MSKENVDAAADLVVCFIRQSSKMGWVH